MDISDVNTVYKVMEEVKKRVEKVGCKEGKGSEESCKYIFDDFDDWCNICILESTLYFLEQSIKINEQVIINEENSDENRQIDKRTDEVSSRHGSNGPKG